LEQMHQVMVQELETEVNEKDDYIEEIEANEITYVNEIKKLKRGKEELGTRELNHIEQLNQWNAAYEDVQSKHQTTSSEMEKLLERQ